MPSFEIKIGVKVVGKVFSPVPRGAAIAKLMMDCKETLADYGVFLVLMRLASVLQNPTGFYESRIKKERQSENWVITDSGVIYGPWLEGTSSRNQISRFKGYRTFQITRRELDQKKVPIVQPIVDRFIRDINS